jgi:hypothetical protein
MCNSIESGAQRERLRRSSTTADVQSKSVRSSMSSQPSSRRATTRASKKMGVSDELAVGVDGEGGGAGSAAGWFGFNVGTSGVAGEMMGSIYRSLMALIKRQRRRESAYIGEIKGMGLTRPIDAGYPCA